MMKIFISYSRKDIAFIEKLSADLKIAGIEAWYDLTGLGGGAHWSREIEKAIKASEYVLVVLSPDSVASNWVEEEILYARKLKLKIIPLLYRSCELPFGFHTLNFIDVQNDEYQRSYKEILRALGVKHSDREVAEKAIREKEEKEAAEKERLEIEEQIRKRIEREAAEKAAYEKAEKEIQKQNRGRVFLDGVVNFFQLDKSEKDDKSDLLPVQKISGWDGIHDIVSVWSNSMEAGRQIFLANLAAHAALTGLRVGLADIEFESPTIHNMFGLDDFKIGKSMNDFLYDRATIREIGLPLHQNFGKIKKLSALGTGGIWLFPASARARDVGQISKEGVDYNKVNEALQTAISEFSLDCLFINLPSKINEDVLLAVATSDVLISVLRPDNRDLQETSTMVEVALSLDVPNLFLVASKVLPKYDFAEIKSFLEAQFQVPVVGVIPLSVDVEGYANDDLFSLCFPSHHWSRSLRNAAQTLLVRNLT